MLPRRLADPSPGQPGPQSTHVSGLFTDGFSWFPYPPREEQSVNDPVIRILGDAVQHSGVHDLAHVSEASTTARQCAALTRSQDSVGQAVGCCLMSDGISSSSPASGAASQASCAETVSPSVVSSHRSMGTTDFLNRPLVCVSNQSLDVPGVPLQRSSDSHTVIPAPTVELYTDASLQGRGAHVDSVSVPGYWTYSEKLLHIDRLELEAAFRARRSFVHFLRGKAVLLSTPRRLLVP